MARAIDKGGTVAQHHPYPDVRGFTKCKNRGPEASRSQKRLVCQKNAILNMARSMKNSGTLTCMTFTEMSFKRPQLAFKVTK